MNDLNYRRKQEFIKELGPKLVNLLRENVHENSWSDSSEIIARIAASMKHKETQKRSGFSIQKKISLGWPLLLYTYASVAYCCTR